MKVNVFQDIVKKYISADLKKAGFKKSKETWNRHKKSLVHVINIQKSQWSSRNDIDFTLNIGIFIHDLNRIVWDKNEPKVIQEYSCFPRYRIGYWPNMYQGRDVWWNVKSESDVDKVGVNVSEILSRNCLPVLDVCCSVVETLKLAKTTDCWNTPGDIISFAVLHCLAGEQEAGIRIVECMLKDQNLIEWHAKCKSILRRLDEFEFI